MAAAPVFTIAAKKRRIALRKVSHQIGCFSSQTGLLQESCVFSSGGLTFDDDERGQHGAQAVGGEAS